MRTHACPACGARAFFVNIACACGADLVYDPRMDAFAEGLSPCANREAIGCNWAAPEPGALCPACAMTEVAPDPGQGDNRALWAEAELAKRRLLAGIGRWGWLGAADAGRLPVFHLLSERTAEGEMQVMMGHMDGLVTINVAEADPAVRVARREAFDEPYRTMIGHFRHEIAHFLFERLAHDPDFLTGFRAVFGDERADYGEALDRHHARGAPADWAARHVSAYASAHPHEDWAESAAHAMHFADLTDSFAAEGLSAPDLPAGYDAYAETDGARLVEIGGWLGIALNGVNRAMGIGDVYPFVLGEVAREKLVFAHRWLRAGP